MRSARIIGGRRCLLLAFRQVPQCEEVPGYRESLHGILHQVRVLEELSGRTAQAPYSGVQHFFHFRRGQVFFKWYGGTYRHVLRDFDHLFVQNERSKRYLAKIGISRVTVVGDTRFDRVLQIREEAKHLPLVELFKNNTMTFVAGSSWQPDEDLFIEYFNQHPEVKLVIAPHVIDENHLVEIIRKLKRPYVRYTRADEKNVRKADCLIIDCFGLLSSIYRYGEIAYIGGGFGVGIHNTLEAAVYGIPVIFGPKYQKFQEAIQLLEAKGAFSVKDYEELKTLLDRMLTDEVFCANQA